METSKAWKESGRELVGICQWWRCRAQKMSLVWCQWELAAGLNSTLWLPAQSPVNELSYHAAPSSTNRPVAVRVSTTVHARDDHAASFNWWMCECESIKVMEPYYRQWPEATGTDRLSASLGRQPTASNKCAVGAVEGY